MSSPVASVFGLTSVRWVGTLGIIASAIGIAATLGQVIGYAGLESLVHTVWEVVPWLVLLVLALLTRFLPSTQSFGAALAQAVVASVVAGPVLVSSLGLLRYALFVEGEIRWPGLSDVTSAISTPMVVVSLFMLIAAASLLVVVVIVPVSRIALISSSTLPRSPFRVEVLTIIGVMVLMAVALRLDDGPVGVLAESSVLSPELALWSQLLAWLVPLSLVLALSLRAAGSASLWIAGGLVITTVAEPVWRVAGSTIAEGLGAAGSPMLPGFSSPQGLSMDRGFVATSFNPWVLVPIIALVLLVILWNTRPSPAIPRQAVVGLGAPINTWAGTALVIAFIPPLAIPAVVLGHASYETIIACGEEERGRLLASTAIVIGILWIAAGIMLPLGALAALATLVGW